MKNDINQIEISEMSKKDRYFSIIESVLFASGEGLTLKNIASIIECDDEFTFNLLEELINKYNEENRGIFLIKMKDEYSLCTKGENSEYVQKLLKTNNRQSLSKAALETLAIIVYKQPITRIEVDEIRGVKSDKAIQNLLDKNIVKESGRKNIPGRPILYSTTGEFLRHFGLKDINEMPLLDSFIEEE